MKNKLKQPVFVISETDFNKIFNPRGSWVIPHPTILAWGKIGSLENYKEMVDSITFENGEVLVPTVMEMLNNQMTYKLVGGASSILKHFKTLVNERRHSKTE